MRLGVTTLWMVAAVSLLVSSPMPAQSTPAAQQPGAKAAQGGGPQEGFKNLQVLPKDIPPQELFKKMREYSGALGVRCGYCHEVDAQTHQPNFASDAKPEKKTARVMISMTQDINEKYLSRIPDTGQQVGCGTCHRGHAKPEAWTPPAEERHP